jgi:hypothetical protein
METISLWILKKAPAWFVSWSFRKIFGKKNLEVFERLLELPKWKKVSIDSPEKWIFSDDNSFVIEVSNETSEFSEPWTDYFPDRRSFRVDVFLKINGELITNALSFIAVDGWCYFVPMPKTSCAYGERYFYWSKESLEYKVFKIIGKVDYLYKDLKEFGDACGVNLVEKI